MTETVYEAATMRPEDVPEDPGAGYELVRGLIFDQVYRFHSRYGGDFDDLVGDAHLAFMEGHISYLTGHAPSGRAYADTYATEIRRWVWFELFDAMRVRLTKRNRLKMSGLGVQDVRAPDPLRSVAELAASLSPDARYVVALVLCPPPELEAEAEGKGGEPRNYRSTVRSALLREGWKSIRIRIAFEDIQNNL